MVKELQIKEIKIFTIGIGKKYREIIPIRDNNVKKLLNIKKIKIVIQLKLNLIKLY